MEDLSGIIMRFRMNRIAISCDIEKTFLQVGLQKQDREVTRFLQLNDLNLPCTEENLATFRFCRVPFGVISSPFLLYATVAYHLKSTNSKLTAEVLRSIYVDNILMGKSTLDEAMKCYMELKQILNGASMNLREWSSNSREFIEAIKSEDRANAGENIDILGLHWNVSSDEIGFKAPILDENILPTKRYVLQNIFEIFDP